MGGRLGGRIGGVVSVVPSNFFGCAYPIICDWFVPFTTCLNFGIFDRSSILHCVYSDSIGSIISVDSGPSFRLNMKRACCPDNPVNEGSGSGSLDFVGGVT